MLYKAEKKLCLQSFSSSEWTRIIIIIIHYPYYMKPQKLTDGVYVLEDIHLTSARVYTSEFAAYFITFFCEILIHHLLCFDECLNSLLYTCALKPLRICKE